MVSETSQRLRIRSGDYITIESHFLARAKDTPVVPKHSDTAGTSDFKSPADTEEIVPALDAR